MKKFALITDVTGQDGSYLTDFLLKKNYKVLVVKCGSSSFNTQRIDPHNKHKAKKHCWSLKKIFFKQHFKEMMKSDLK